MDVIGITDLRQNAKAVINGLHEAPVTVVSRSRPVAVLLHPDRWERVLERLDELEVRLALATNDQPSPWAEAQERIHAQSLADERVAELMRSLQESVQALKATKRMSGDEFAAMLRPCVAELSDALEQTA